MVSHDSRHMVTVEDESEQGLRLDKLLAARLPELSRTRIQALLEAGHITRADGGSISSASAKVKYGDAFTVQLPQVEESVLQPVAMDLDIIYEDEAILVVNKPAGLTVHPAPGHPSDTLVNALLAHCKGSLSGIGGVARPGIVHRIDKDTSGLLVVAKHDQAHAHLARQLKSHKLKRIYRAICWGVPPFPEGTIEGDIGRNPKDRKKMAVVKSGGKEAVTHYRMFDSFYLTRESPKQRNTLQRDPIAAYVECELETGRTHQIRVHFAHHHLPLVGDPVYGSSTESRLKSAVGKALPQDLREILSNFNRQALHAHELVLVHPTSKEEMRFTAPLPDDFLMVLNGLQALKL